MARRLLRGLILLGLTSAIAADQTIVIDGQDTAIHYETVNQSSSLATWTTVQRSPDNCDTPQRLTSRIGDTMTYTFTGTGVFVVGTIGAKRGILQFQLDGVNSTFDRSAPELSCNAVLFQKTGLSNQQHTIVASLFQQQINFGSGQLDGVLSIQRIRYTIPGGPSGNKGLVIGLVIAGLIVLAIVAFLVFRFWKNGLLMRRVQKRRAQQGFFDDDDAPGRPKDEIPASMMATPFEWDGQQQRGQAIRNPNAYGVQNGQYHDPGPVPAGPRTHSSSGSGGGGDPRRESATTAPGSTLVMSNPDFTAASSESGPGYGRPEKSGYPGSYAMEPMAGPSRGRESVGSGQPLGPNDPFMVDRIAQRLADIMTERVGVVGGPAPPEYDGPTPASGSTPATGYPPTSSSASQQTQIQLQQPPTGRRPTADQGASPEASTSPPQHSPTRTSRPISPPRPSPPAFDSTGAGGRFGPRPRPQSGRPQSSASPPTTS